MEIRTKGAKKILDFARFSWGNVLEWYDFTLYGLFSIQLSHAFFGASKDSLLFVFMTFAVGFMARPLGGILFGYLGDKFGHKFAVTIAIWLMVIPTLGIGLLPSYAKLGIYAPLILIFLRILQGLSAGGQFSGLLVIAGEGSQKNSGLLTSIVYSISVVGGLLASIISFLALLVAKYSHNQFLVDHYWRLPFFFSLVLFIIYLKLNYNQEFNHHSSKLKYKFKLVLTSKPLALLCLTLFSMLNGGLYYILYNYLVTFLVLHNGVFTSYAFFIENIILFLSVFLYPALGYLSDLKVNKLRWSFIFLAIMLFALLLIFRFKNNGLISVIGLLILVIADCGLTSFMINIFTHSFNTPYKMSIFSLGFNVGASLSGFAPLVMESISSISVQYSYGFMFLIILMLAGNLSLYRLVNLSR